MPAMTPEKASMRKLLRTRSTDQLRSAVGTTSKLTAEVFARRPFSGGNERKCDALSYWLGPKPPGRGGRTPPGRGGYGRRPVNPPGPPGPAGLGPLRKPPGRGGRKATGPRAPGAVELTTTRRFGSIPTDSVLM